LELLLAINIKHIHLLNCLRQKKLIDTFSGKTLIIKYDSVNRTGKILNINGQTLPTTIAYWFAWMAFHPDSEVYKKD